MALLKTEFTKCSEKLAKAGNSAKQHYRINTEQLSQTQGSLV